MSETAKLKAFEEHVKTLNKKFRKEASSLKGVFEILEEQIKKKETPTVTDLSIVVIEPKEFENRSVVAYANNEITMIPIVRPPDDPGVDEEAPPDEFSEQIGAPKAQAGGWRGFWARWWRCISR